MDIDSINDSLIFPLLFPLLESSMDIDLLSMMLLIREVVLESPQSILYHLIGTRLSPVKSLISRFLFEVCQSQN